MGCRAAEDACHSYTKTASEESIKQKAVGIQRIQLTNALIFIRKVDFGTPKHIGFCLVPWQPAETELFILRISGS